MVVIFEDNSVSISQWRKKSFAIAYKWKWKYATVSAFVCKEW